MSFLYLSQEKWNQAVEQLNQKKTQCSSITSLLKTTLVNKYSLLLLFKSLALFKMDFFSGSISVVFIDKLIILFWFWKYTFFVISKKLCMWTGKEIWIWIIVGLQQGCTFQKVLHILIILTWQHHARDNS